MLMTYTYMHMTIIRHRMARNDVTVEGCILHVSTVHSWSLSPGYLGWILSWHVSFGNHYCQPRLRERNIPHSSLKVQAENKINVTLLYNQNNFISGHDLSICTPYMINISTIYCHIRVKSSHVMWMFYYFALWLMSSNFGQGADVQNTHTA